MKTINEVIIERCRQLAEGAEVEDRGDGICWDLLQYCHGQGVETSVKGLYPRLQACFEAFDLDQQDPLGDYWVAGDKWEGERGERRRFLAGRMAEYFESLQVAAC